MHPNALKDASDFRWAQIDVDVAGAFAAAPQRTDLDRW